MERDREGGSEMFVERRSSSEAVQADVAQLVTMVTVSCSPPADQFHCRLQGRVGGEEAAAASAAEEQPPSSPHHSLLPVRAPPSFGARCDV